MSVTGFVLIETAVGEPRAVATACAALHGDEVRVTRVSIVTGPYSVILRVDVDDMSALGAFVTDTLHRIPGIRQTVTCIELEEHTPPPDDAPGAGAGA